MLKCTERFTFLLQKTRLGFESLVRGESNVAWCLENNFSNFVGQFFGGIGTMDVRGTVNPFLFGGK